MDGSNVHFPESDNSRIISGLEAALESWREGQDNEVLKWALKVLQQEEVPDMVRSLISEGHRDSDGVIDFTSILDLSKEEISWDERVSTSYSSIEHDRRVKEILIGMELNMTKEEMSEAIDLLYSLEKYIGNNSDVHNFLPAYLKPKFEKRREQMTWQKYETLLMNFILAEIRVLELRREPLKSTDTYRIDGVL